MGPIVSVRGGGWCQVSIENGTREIHVRAAHLIVTQLRDVNVRFKRRHKQKKRVAPVVKVNKSPRMKTVKTRLSKPPRLSKPKLSKPKLSKENVFQSLYRNDEDSDETDEETGMKSANRESGKDIAFDLVSAKIVMPNQTEAFVSSFFPGAFDSKLKPVWKVEMKSLSSSSRPLRKCALRTADLSLYDVLMGRIRYLAQAESSDDETTTTTTKKIIFTFNEYTVERTLRKCAQDLKRRFQSQLRNAIAQFRESNGKDVKNLEELFPNRKSSLQRFQRFREH